MDAILEGCGAAIIDADALVHDLLRPGTPHTRQVAAEFGEEFLTADGAVTNIWDAENRLIEVAPARNRVQC